MCYFIELLLHSADNEQASVSMADQLLASTLASEPSRKRLRALSDEIESILFSDLDPVAAADGSSTNSAAVSEDEGRAPSSKRARTGWDSAAEPSKHRSAQDFASKKPAWEVKLAKCKNAMARAVVENAFAKNTPNGWKGKRFPSNEGTIVPEKEVMTAYLILSDEANISAQRRTGRMGQTIIGRGSKAKVWGSFTVLTIILMLCLANSR